MEAIGKELDWHKSTVSRAINKAMTEIIQEPAELIVTQELERLDAMLEGLWPRATAGNVRAVEGVLQIMNRRARYLGLDDFDKRMLELAERRQQLDEAQGALVYALMNRVFDRLELTPQQRALLPVIVPDEIAAIEAAAEEGKPE
jgi:hypothetical protein